MSNISGQWSSGFTYDKLGNALTTTDAEGVVITNTYDNLNRTETITYSGESSGQQSPIVYFTYDGIYYRSDNFRMQATGNAKGALTQVRNTISTSQTTAYDPLGRAEIYQQITDGQTYSSSYQYNLAGALVQETYPSGRTVKNEFNTDGDLSRIAGKANITAMEKTYANNFAYTAAGAIAKLKLGNGLWEAAKFNTRLQITELGLGIAEDNLNQWKVNYDYGEIEANGTLNTAKNTGNIAKQTISFQGLTNPFIQTYKYDSVNRLVDAVETNGVTQTWKQTFDYDRFGNRIEFYQKIGNLELVLNNRNHPSVDANTNKFLTSESYTYDKNGNITSDPTNGGNNSRSFTFSGENKQTEVRDASNNIVGQYFYDGEGKRVKKVTSTETTVFVYSDGKLIAEYSTQPPPISPTTNYVATDILQSVRAISNANGVVTSRRDFTPFGEELIPDGQFRKTDDKYLQEIDSVRQKFTGYQKDTES